MCMCVTVRMYVGTCVLACGACMFINIYLRVSVNFAVILLQR